MYWDRFARTRITRRRGLQFAVVLSLGSAGAAVLGCSSGSKSTNTASQAKDESGLLSQRVDTTSKATRGGIMTVQVGSDPPDMDPLTSAAVTQAHTIYVYSRPLKYKVGKFPDKPTGAVEPDAAESFELAPDGMQITLKVRANLPYDSRPPTNGRMLDAGDIKFSWDKFAAKSVNRSDYANAVNPNAPIVSVSTPDSRTAVFKLAYPYAPIVDTLPFENFLQLEPREADGGFDPRGDMRGSGAWFLSSYNRSSDLQFRRNPGWYDKDRPYLDGVERIIISEYATGLAQFKAGHLWSFTIRPEDVVATKKEVSDLVMLQATAWTRATPNRIFFGLKEGSPFRDERVRQAISRLIDRDLYIETLLNTKQFQSQGLTVPTRWSTTIPVGEEQYWLDPKTKDLGTPAQFWSYDVAEAKKLLKAAGFNGPIETPYSFITSSQFGPSYAQGVEVIRGMLEANGDFKLKTNNPDYQTDFLPNYYFGKGNFEGLLPSPAASAPHIDSYLFTEYHSKGARFKLPFTDSNTAIVDGLIEKQRSETDQAKRVEIVKQIQKELSAHLYSVPYDGATLGFSLDQPWIGNLGVYGSWSGASPQEATTYLWFDSSKKKA